MLWNPDLLIHGVWGLLFVRTFVEYHLVRSTVMEYFKPRCKLHNARDRMPRMQAATFTTYSVSFG